MYLDHIEDESSPHSSDSEGSESGTQSRRRGGGGEESEKVYVVDSIVGSREYKGSKQYRVHWQGYNPTHDSWEPESELLKTCAKLIDEFEEKYEAKLEALKAKPHKRSQDVFDISDPTPPKQLLSPGNP